MEQTVKAYAQRMMKAIDEQNSNSSYKYRIESSEKEYDEEGNITDVISVFESNGDSETEVYRFYEFKYGKFLTSKFQESNILYRFSSLLFVLIARLLSVIKSIFSFKDEINKKSKVQALYFTIIYIGLAIYLFLLIPSILGIIAGVISDVEIINFSIKIPDKVENAINVIISLFSAFMLLTPNSKNIFSAMAVEYFAANQYLSIGDRRLIIMGKLNRLIEVISEEENNVEIEIHSYSFGTVLAIDAIFPYESEPNTRIKNTIVKLITIGCPFDFIEIYWTNYFANRKYSNLSLKSWKNISSDLDVLSSKFDGFPKKQQKFIDSTAFWENLGKIDITYNMVNPSQVSYLQMLMFYGLKAHQMYWDKHLDSRSCLTRLMDN